MPRSLGLNQLSYPREQFYSDVQGYIRFKTPVIQLRTIADAHDPLSPLATIDSSISAIRVDPRDLEVQRRLGHELRMFGCVTRAQLRDRVTALRSVMRRLPVDAEPAAVEHVRALVHRFTSEVHQVLEAWRVRQVEFVDGDLPPVLRETYACTDEYLTQLFEHKLTNLIAETDGEDQLVAIREDLRAEIELVRGYRKARGFQGADDGDNEYFVFRRSMLKKLVNSVLWLEISKQKDGRGLGNLGAAIAAGTAMALALAASIIGSRWYLTDTWGFVLAGTIIYIFKDRLKDWLKGYLSVKSGRFLSDYTTEIRDPVSGREIGQCRESFRYLEARELPHEVLARRHSDSNSPLEPAGKPEVVIKYEKDVRLSSACLIERLHLADYEVNDIMRFCVTQFLVRADDPVSTLPVYDPQTDAVVRREFQKMYHLNMVMVMRSAGCPPSTQRIRVVFDKRGIRRLEAA